MHSPGHLLLTLGDDFNSHGTMFKDATYKLLGFTSNCSNSQALFLSHQLISVSLHGSRFHLMAIYVSDLVEHIIIFPKRKIPLDIMMENFTCQAPGYLCTEEPY